jgi:predicted GIY-YIG superfamily endonuclease
MTEAKNGVATALYRHFNADDDLLYVGISLDPFHRMTKHKEQSAWFSQVARITIEWFPDRKSACAAERAAIIAERPRLNNQHNPVRPLSKAFLEKLRTSPCAIEVAAKEKALERLGQLLGLLPETPRPSARA